MVHHQHVHCHRRRQIKNARFSGGCTELTTKRAGIEQLSIEWELGSGDDGYIAGQVTYAEPELSDLSKPSAAMGKFLSDTQYAFTLEPYVNGTPAPSLVTKEVDMVVAAPFLLVNPDFSNTEVVKAYAHTIVVPAMDYTHTRVCARTHTHTHSAGCSEEAECLRP
jgi:hypothetical protein